MGVKLRGDHVTCWHRLEDGKVLLHIGYRRLVVILETTQEACLGCYLFVPVEVINDQFLVLRAIVVSPVVASAKHGVIYSRVHL